MKKSKTMRMCLVVITGYIGVAVTTPSVTFAGNGVRDMLTCFGYKKQIKVSKKKGLLAFKEVTDKAYAECPDTPYIIFQHGYSLERQRKYPEAEKMYKRAIRYQKDYPFVYISLGDVYYAQNEFKEAVVFYQEGLKVCKNDLMKRRTLRQIVRAKNCGNTGVPGHKLGEGCL